MRPLKLEMIGFSAFRDPTTVDFTGTDLIALVGPTGSGKSSIIDAVTFALYGSVSRYDDARLVAPVIHQLCNEARVRLDFELDGQRYTAVRVVRRTKSGATTKEARLIRVTPDGQDEVVEDQAKQVSSAVGELLGLDFDQFTRTVVLPQGEFASFLREDKQKRQQLLRQLLDVGVYEQMGRLARKRADEAKTRGESLAEQRAALGEVSDSDLSAMTDHRKALADLAPRVGVALTRIGELEGEVARWATAQRSVRSELSVVEALKVPAEVATLGVELSEAEAARNHAAGRLTEARDLRSRAGEAYREGPDAAPVRTALDRLDERDRLREEMVPLRPAVATAAEIEDAAVRAEADAGTQRDAAEATLAWAKDAAGAQSLVAALAVGQPCPVCRQTVAALPDHDLDVELAEAKATFEAARANHGTARENAAIATRRLNEVTTQLATREEALALAESRIDPGVDRASLIADLERATLLGAEAAKADGALAEAERRASDADLAVERLRRREAELRHDHTEARDAVAARKPPRPGGRALAEDWKQLVAWATEMTGPLRAEAVEAEIAERESRSALEVQAAAVSAECRSLGIESGPGLVERVSTALADAGHAVAMAEQRRSEAAALDERIDAVGIERAVDREMGQLLDATGFERWLLQEALDDLMARATDRLLELSAGQFSLESSDGDFWIRDHRNADERRSVRTLSGGETFLASLALALALAENVADLASEGGPRLDSMFLDEGFGTLDPSTLDVVASALEELSASGRLIAIVTHIRDLADRMPVRLEVHRDTTTARVARVEQ